MTDKARELLERAASMLETYMNTFKALKGESLAKEIRAYLAEPEVKREALSYDEIEKKYWGSIGLTSWTCFIAGVRFAEKHHGIGGGDE